MGKKMKAKQNYDILSYNQFQDEMAMKIKDINIHQLMGIDHDVHIKRNAKWKIREETKEEQQRSREACAVISSSSRVEGS